jgi:hypothetical protein
MRFLMMMIPHVYQPDTPAAERAGENFAPRADEVAKMMKYNEELAKGARVSFKSGKANVTDGPFIESKEVIGGFWIIQAKSREEAVDWARRVPAADGDVIEIRQIFEMSDFPDDVKKALANPRVNERRTQT